MLDNILIRFPLNTYPETNPLFFVNRKNQIDFFRNLYISSQEKPILPPIIIKGPSQIGKTSILYAFCNELKKIGCTNVKLIQLQNSMTFLDQYNKIPLSSQIDTIEVRPVLDLVKEDKMDEIRVSSFQFFKKIKNTNEIIFFFIDIIGPLNYDFGAYIKSLIECALQNNVINLAFIIAMDEKEFNKYAIFDKIAFKVDLLPFKEKDILDYIMILQKNSLVYIPENLINNYILECQGSISELKCIFNKIVEKAVNENY